MEQNKTSNKSQKSYLRKKCIDIVYGLMWELARTLRAAVGS